MPTIRANTAVDPSQIASMFDPLAAAFKPPTGQEILAGAKARQTQQQIQYVKDLYDYAAQPGIDQRLLDNRLAVIGQQNGGSSLTAVGMNNATSQANNAADNARALQQTQMQQSGETTRTMLAPVSEGATRFVPPSIAGSYQVPGQQQGVVKLNEGQTAVLPSGGTVAGTPKPLTEADMKGAILRGLPQADQRSVAMQGVPVETVMQGGVPKILPRDQAAGMTPAPSQAEPKFFNYDTPDGKTGTARTGPDGGLYDTQSGERLPQGLKTYTAQLSGSKEQTGLSAGVTSGLQQRRIDLEMMKGSSRALRKLATEHPEAIGTTGSVLGFGQNLLATGSEVASLLGPKAKQYMSEVQTGALPPEMRNYFNPKIPEAQMIENTLLAQYAKVLDPGGRLSDQRMKQAAEALGVGGTLRSAKNTMSTLDALDNFIAQQQQVMDVGDPKSGYLNAPGNAPAAPVAPAAPGGQKVRRKWTADGQLQ